MVFFFFFVNSTRLFSFFILVSPLTADYTSDWSFDFEKKSSNPLLSLLKRPEAFFFFLWKEKNKLHREERGSDDVKLSRGNRMRIQTHTHSDGHSLNMCVSKLTQIMGARFWWSSSSGIYSMFAQFTNQVWRLCFISLLIFAFPLFGHTSTHKNEIAGLGNIWKLLKKGSDK